MNPENNTQMNEPVVTNPAVKNPHPVNQVTTVSKYLALVLFVLLPFLGGYVGYQLASVPVTEITIPNNNQTLEKENTNSSLHVYNNNNLHTENEYQFSFEVPAGWKVSETNANGQLAVPPEGVKHLLLKKIDESKGIIISIVPKNELGSFFGCYRFVFSVPENNYVRQNDSVSERCIDEENVLSHDNSFLNPNFVLASTSALKSSGSKPVTVLVPFLPEFGLHITVINWNGETNLGEIDAESQLILDSLKEI